MIVAWVTACNLSLEREEKARRSVQSFSASALRCGAGGRILAVAVNPQPIERRHAIVVQCVFTGDLVECKDQVQGVFIKSGFWGYVHLLLEAREYLACGGLISLEGTMKARPIRSYVSMRSLETKDLKGLREEWRKIRIRKSELGLPLANESIGDLG